MMARLVACLLLIVVTLVVFAPVTDFDFVNFQDPQHVTRNHRVQNGLSVANVAWAATPGRAGQWQPLTWLSHMVDCDVFGADAPGAHHFMNVLLHALGAAVLLLALARMTGALWRSAMVAGVFALHPLQVEAAAWVSQRNVVLGTLLAMLSVYAYAAYVQAARAPGLEREARSKLRFAGVVLLYALCLLADPTTVWLPLLLLILDYWPLNRTDESAAVAPRSAMQLLGEKAALLVLAGALLMAAHLARWLADTGAPLEPSQPWQRLYAALIVPAYGIGKVLWPHDLAAYYPPSGVRSIVPVLVAGVVLVCVTAMVILPGRRHRYLVAGWLWYLAVLMPTATLAIEGWQARGDSAMHVAIIGLAIMACWGVAGLVRYHRQAHLAAGAAGGLLLLLCALLTRAQLQHWRDSVTLFEHAAAATATNPVTCAHLGQAYLDQDRISDGIEQFNLGLEFDPYSGELHRLLGWALHRRGDLDGAIEQLRRAIALEPGRGEAHLDLGKVMHSQGYAPAALEHYRRAGELLPEDPRVYLHLGMATADLGRVDEAIRYFGDALELNPRDARAHLHMGQALLRRHDYAQASHHFQITLELSPQDAAAYVGLGAIAQAHRQLDDAQRYYEYALALDPENSRAMLSLALVLADKGQTTAAIAQLTKVLRLEPQNAQAHRKVGLLLSAQKQFDPALGHLRELVRLEPDDASALLDLGKALTAAGLLDEASLHLTQALRLKPDSAGAQQSMGDLLLAQRQPEAALRHYLQAVNIDPNLADAHLHVANLQRDMGQLADASGHYAQVVTLKPRDANARYHLANALASVGQYRQSVEQYREALRLVPNWSHALSSLAWVLATCPDTRVRNGAEAVDLAEAACKQTGQQLPEPLDTLAAAYAEAGRFEDALRTAQRAQLLASSAGRDALARDIGTRLDAYKVGRSARAGPPPADP